MQSVLILSDVQNVYYTTRQQFGCNFDYNRFWRSATANRNVVNAFAYAIDSGDEKQRQFQNILRAIGFEVKLKPFIRRADGTAKGDWDVGITIDAMEHAADVDVVILLSGDGDFAILANHIRAKYNVEVEVYGVEALTAKALIDAADRYVPIAGELLLQR
ncbi:NYN domain-containing protein [Ferrimonas lipolytica]|uniref:NYN domain-containing protein n=1 Tax=Ferrimonas lipolytica TaxID=2724191 RepID=A0A6H1UCU1_9GAMM|nr:NYN domain-containing protein [Ferrimonas lipolytica]QIZ76449.1 NYN domain-containing protein [Ferrimonas lipolytica]